MAYVFKQKFNIAELISKPSNQTVVLIVEPDIYLAKLAERHLVAVGYRSCYCPDILLLEEFLSRVNPTVLLFNPEACRTFGIAAGLIKKIIGGYPSLRVVTITHDIPGQNLSQMMNAGIASHINRKLTKPKDVAEIIRTLIINK